jgi:hypothetical protein
MIVPSQESKDCSWDVIFAEKLNFKVPLIWLEFRVAHA